MNQKRVIDASRGWNDLGRTTIVNGSNQSVIRKQPNLPTQKTNGQQVRANPEQQQPHVGYIPKQVVRQQPQQPAQNYTVSVNPHANIVFQNPQQSVQQPPQTLQPVRQVQQPPQTVQQAVSQVQQVPSIQKKDAKSGGLGYDPDMRNFDLDGCKTIEEVYEKNRHIIKIIPE